MLGLPAVSKREVLASMFLQGMLTNEHSYKLRSREDMVEEAIYMADLLLAALAKSKP